MFTCLMTSAEHTNHNALSFKSNTSDIYIWYIKRTIHRHRAVLQEYKDPECVSSLEHVGFTAMPHQNTPQTQQQEWEAIPQNVIRSYCSSMGRHILAVLEANGLDFDFMLTLLFFFVNLVFRLLYV